MSKRNILNDAMERIDKDMVDDALSYEREKRGFDPAVIAIAAAVALISVIPAALLIGPMFMRGRTNVHNDALSSPEATELISEQATDSATVTGAITEEEPDTEAVTEEQLETTAKENKSPDPDAPENYIRPVEYIPELGAPVTVDMTPMHMDVMYGYECKDVMSYTVQYNKPLTEGKHGERLKVMIKHTDGIELLIPEIFVLDYTDTKQRFDLKFRYAGEKTNGSFSIYFIDDHYDDIDKYTSIEQLDSIDYTIEFRSVSRLLECSAVRTKEYNFFKAN